MLTEAHKANCKKVMQINLDRLTADWMTRETNFSFVGFVAGLLESYSLSVSYRYIWALKNGYIALLWINSAIGKSIKITLYSVLISNINSWSRVNT